MALFSIVPIEVCLDSRLSKMQIRVLVALLSFRSKNTDSVWPSRRALSQRCGYSEQSISRVTTQLADLGWLQKQGKGGFSKSCSYMITVPDSATVSEPATVSGSGMSTVSESGTLTVSEPVTRKEQTIEQTSEQTSVSRKRSLITIDEFIKDCRESGVKAIPDDDPIFDTAEQSNVPHEFLALNWRVFVRNFRESGKKYKDWRAVYRRSVRERWHNLWWHDANNNCQLTSTGRQASLEFANHE